jgi:dephospho-CoA kinase
MVRVAVTGGIACGKSRVVSYLRERGIAVCETDGVAHGVMAPGGPAHASVFEAFGGDIQDKAGGIDRQKLASIVFDDPGRMAELNRLVHPFVKTEVARWLVAREESGADMAAVEVPLLFEAGMNQGWDAIICVGCSGEVQEARLRERGLSQEACRRRIAAQMPLSSKVARSDYVIWNDGTERELEQKIEDVLKEIQEN